MNSHLSLKTLLLAVFMSGILAIGCTSHSNSAGGSFEDSRAGRQSQSLNRKAFGSIALDTSISEPVVFEVSLSGRFSALVGKNGEIALATHDAGSSRLGKQVIKVEGSKVLSLAFSPMEDEIAVAQTSKITRYSLPGLEQLGVQSRFSGRPASLDYSPGGRSLLAGLGSGEVLLWGLKEGEAAGKNSSRALEKYLGGKGKIIEVFAHPRGQIIIAVAKNGRVFVWPFIKSDLRGGYRDKDSIKDLGREQEVEEPIIEAGYELADAELSADGRTLYLLGRNARLTAWTLKGVRASYKNDSASFERILPSKMADSNGRGFLSFGFGKLRKGGLGYWCEGAKSTPNTVGSFPIDSLQAEGSSFQPEFLGSSADSELLWLASKTGSLRVFDAREFLIKPETRSLLASCRL